jgi:hypothetical protein
VHQRPMDIDSYDDGDSVAAGIPGIDDGIRPENRGSSRTDPCVATGFGHTAGPSEPGPGAGRATDQPRGPLVHGPPVRSATAASGPGLPDRIAQQ